MEATRLLAAGARGNAWANHRPHRACSVLSPEELTAKRAGFFPSILETLARILMVDRYFLAMLEGGTEADRNQANFVRLGFAAIRDGQRESDRRLVAFCEGLTAADLEREVVLIRPQGRYRETVSGVLLHLFQPDIHHRGQVHAMLSDSSVAPPQLDEFFLDQDPHLRAVDLAVLGWPEEAHW